MRHAVALITVAYALAACSGTTGVDAGDVAPNDAGDAASASDVLVTDTLADVPADIQGLTAAPWKGPWALRMETTSVTVRWETRIAPPDTGVSYAPENGGAAQMATGATTSAMVTAGLQNNVVRDPDLTGVFYLNEVTLTGLAPASCYQFHLVAYPDAAGRVCTAHDATDHTTPLRFMAIGDTNPTLGLTLPVLAAVLPRAPEFIIHAGDMQYYSSIAETWQTWFGMMAPMLRAGALLPCIGNHENELGGAEFVDYYQRLFTPASGDGDAIRYHFQSGGVHFFSLSTEDALAEGSPQRAWLDATLSAAAASPGYRFAVLYLHRPLYTLGDAAPRLDLRASLGPLISTYHVRLVVQGHMHGYERFEVGDVTYLTAAGGGASIGDVNAGVAMYPADVPLRVASGAFAHAVILTVNGTTLHGDVIDGMATVRDSFDHTVP